MVKFNYKARSPDIIWGQIKRASSAISTQMEVEGFKVLRHIAFTDEKNEACLIFEFDSLDIPKDRVHEGPEFFSEADLERFIAKNSKKSELMWINKKGKILSLQKRKHSNAKLFLQDLLKNNLDKSGVPKGLKADIKKGFKITARKKH